MGGWKKTFPELSYRDTGPAIGQSEIRFTVWAPYARTLDLVVGDRKYPAESDEFGIWRTYIPMGNEQVSYMYSIDGLEGLPDPGSRYQSQGVFGPSSVVPMEDFTSRNFVNINLRDTVIYELHTGTFSQEGTFAGMIKKLDHLADLGINAIELMPISQFEGRWNWGYDGVFPYAVHNTYGTANDLRKLVEEVHSRKISIILDVVYNHLGPRGNVFPKYGPYFSSLHKTAWGPAMNFDGEWSDYVRQFFIQNAIFWLDAYGFDGLRLDAIHGIFDSSPSHFLAELSKSVKNHFSETAGGRY